MKIKILICLKGGEYMLRNPEDIRFLPPEALKKVVGRVYMNGDLRRPDGGLIKAQVIKANDPDPHPAYWVSKVIYAQNASNGEWARPRPAGQSPEQPAFSPSIATTRPAEAPPMQGPFLQDGKMVPVFVGTGK